jgi:hypothetical protein
LLLLQLMGVLMLNKCFLLNVSLHFFIKLLNDIKNSSRLKKHSVVGIGSLDSMKFKSESINIHHSLFSTTLSNKKTER